MTTPPRSHGTPLDEESAKRRALQIAAAADPFRLRVFSLMASDPEGFHDVPTIAAQLSATEGDVESALTMLIEADLVDSDDGQLESFSLTPDAWVRFARLLSPSGSPEADETDTPNIFAGEQLPPVVGRIIDQLADRTRLYFSRETVARVVEESYRLLEQRARIKRHLPSLTSRFAADRLDALAGAQGLRRSGVPEVLFVCVRNAGRSQIAAAVLRHIAGDGVHVRTAGSAPGTSVHSTVIDVLDEIGVPLAAEFPKPLTDEVVRASDVIVTMGCGDACPVYPGRRYMDWALDDPADMMIDELRVLRDDIVERVTTLARELKV